MADAREHIDAIRAALAMSPTGGAWFVSHECRRDDEAVCDLVNNTWVLKQPHVQLGRWEADAAHIAACHPEAMRAILAHIDAQSAEIERLRTDAARWRYAVAIGGNQTMNWLDVYDDWNGDGEFAAAIDAAMKENDHA